MPRSAGPLIPRRRFGGEIKRLREARGETLADTAGALLISTSKLSRLENGQGELRARDVRDLLAYFEIGDAAEGAQLREWAEQARVPGWWQSGYAMPPKLDTFIAYENAATEIWDYVPSVAPGLLQTPDYTAEIFRTFLPELSNAEVAMQVELRHRRTSEVLDRPDPPRVVIALPEEVLHRPVGSSAVMRSQLDALVAAFDRPDLDLHVVPFSAGIYRAMDGGFTIFRFAHQNDVDVVAVSTVSTTLFLDQDEQVADHKRRFDDLRSRWLGRAASRKLIASHLSGGAHGERSAQA